MINWYTKLNPWQQAGVCGIAAAIVFAVVFPIASGEPMMAIGGLIAGFLSGAAAYRFTIASRDW